MSKWHRAVTVAISQTASAKHKQACTAQSSSKSRGDAWVLLKRYKMKNTLTFCPYKLITGPENSQKVTVLCFSSNLQNILVKQKREREKRKEGRKKGCKLAKTEGSPSPLFYVSKS